VAQVNPKHLEFIQSVITRMNTNCFQIKGWNITVVAALLAVYASTKNELFILVSLLPNVTFWLLDTYYLMQERKFRALYEDVARISEDHKEIKEFSMKTDLYKGGRFSYFDVLTSSTIVWLYPFLLLILIGTFIYLKWSCQH